MKLKMYKTIVWPLCLILFIGFIFVGHNDVLCISEDGHMKFETECLPCCTETDDICKLDEPNNLQEKHIACFHCSDLTMDGTLWLKRLTKTSLQQSDKSDLVLTFKDNLILTPISNIAFKENNSLLSFYKSPQSLSIAVTIILC